MKKFLLCISIGFTFLPHMFSQGICDPGGNIIIYSNYDGGTLNISIDEDIPDIRVGICSYESVTVNFSGAFVDNVAEVLYAGYDDAGTTAVTGVPDAIVEILLYPPVTLTDPDGYPYMICAYDCDTDYVPGGCNTVDQLTDYFLTELSGTFRFSYLQYGVWSGTYYISDGGNCCFGGMYEPAPVDAGIIAITNPSGGCGMGTDENVTVTIKNYGATDISSVPVNYTLDGGVAISETAAVAIASGGSATYTFTTMADISSAGLHTINAYTSLADDADESNDDLAVSINSLATPLVDLGADQNACDELTLDAGNPGSTYAWSTGASTQEIVVTTTGAYSVTVTNPLTGCISSDIINVDITASPIASFTYTVEGSSISFTNTSTIGAYTWNFGDGSAISTLPSPSHTYAVEGTYTVTLTVSNTCGDDVYTAIISTVSPEIITLGNNTQVSINPNPATEWISICIDGSPEENITCTIYSINGDMLLQPAVLHSGFDCNAFDLRSFSKGTYILQLQSPEGNGSALLIIK